MLDRRRFTPLQVRGLLHGMTNNTLPRIVADAGTHRSVVIVVAMPDSLPRLELYRELGGLIARWGRRANDVGAFLDLSNHPAMAAQSIVGDHVRTWPDLADGLPDELAHAGILVVAGLEQMLQDTPNRLAAFLDARAAHQLVIVLSPQAEKVARLPIRNAPVHLDLRLAQEDDIEAMAKGVFATGVSAAMAATRRESLL